MAAEPEWDAINSETLQRFQAMLQVDTSNPPGNEAVLAEQLAEILRAEDIDVELYSRDPTRSNLVARLPGNGSKEPLLLMAHLDVVTVDPAKWTFPPFGGTVDEQWIYGRGAVVTESGYSQILHCPRINNLSSSLMLICTHVGRP